MLEEVDVEALLVEVLLVLLLDAVVLEVGVEDGEMGVVEEVDVKRAGRS